MNAENPEDESKEKINLLGLLAKFDHDEGSEVTQKAIKDFENTIKYNLEDFKNLKTEYEKYYLMVWCSLLDEKEKAFILENKKLFGFHNFTGFPNFEKLLFGESKSKDKN